VARILDGKACARSVRARIRREIAGLGGIPHVAFVQVGEIPASTTYVNAKSTAAEKVGMHSTIYRIEGYSTQAQLLALIDQLNDDPGVHGILVQLPLPEHIDPLAVALAISPDKDVDCFHPANVGRLTLGLDGPKPATPQGILMLLDYYELDVRGLEAVIVGRSNLVGKPLGVMLLARHATVQWTHSATRDLGSHTRSADLLISAAGRAGLIRADMVKPGAIVVDVSTNYVPQYMEADDGVRVIHIRGQRDKHVGVDPHELPADELKLVGDVDFEAVEKVASWISPVPGGVGPMTIASVLWNGLTLYKLSL
jgi:methylenetetrahydrofolate dehydrogenase (NADP+)/methenyltetrahydrofolate cyclohydrolase